MPKKSGSTNRHLPQGLRIIHEDRDILVVEKPSGLLTVATDRDKTRTVYHALTDYVRKGQAKSRNRIFIVHRLDREASGILVFAKNKDARDCLQGSWKEAKKTYLALVHGKPKYRERTITSYLKENRAFVVYSTSNTKDGKLAHTAYRVIREAEGMSLLEVDLLTGRKHQIRVHLAESGHPIVGDRKYGEKKSSHKGLSLHAAAISFRHPRSGKACLFETERPEFVRRFEALKS
jgi:tRNA pseudouridine32 synthase/23S rRNA pseudouridine746 synthase/23S rRNA pseudouridine1911/1915/1917 synthase